MDSTLPFCVGVKGKVCGSEDTRRSLDSGKGLLLPR